MAVTRFRWFDSAIDKIAKNIIRLDTGTFKCVLTDHLQSIDETFVGSSTDCRYADLTHELTTASGYTAGGFTLTTPVFSRTANVVKFTSDPIQWTLSAGISYKYAIIYADNTNKDLLCFLDAEDTSGSSEATPTSGTLTITPNASGIVGWQRT